MEIKVFKNGIELPIKWGTVKATLTLADGREIDAESEEFRELMRKRAEERDA